MRIATWNVNGLRARLEFLKIWLDQRQPDIIGLQEIKVSEEEFPYDELNNLGYDVVTHAQKGWNGVCVISRHSLDLESAGLPGQEDMGARLITATVQDLSFTTIYVPNGKDVDHDDYSRKLSWLDALQDHWINTRDRAEPAIICGDFNVVPAAIDSWRGNEADGRIFHTAEERRRIAAFTDAGLTDLFRDRYPLEQQFSWWDYRGGAFRRGHGLRIDFVLGTDSIRERVVDVTIDREFRKKQDGLTASDHVPVFVDLS